MSASANGNSNGNGSSSSPSSTTSPSQQQQQQHHQASQPFSLLIRGRDLSSAFMPNGDLMIFGQGMAISALGAFHYNFPRALPLSSLPMYSPTAMGSSLRQQQQQQYSSPSSPNASLIMPSQHVLPPSTTMTPLTTSTTRAARPEITRSLGGGHHPCPFCGETFGQDFSLNEHVMSKHPSLIVGSDNSGKKKKKKDDEGKDDEDDDNETDGSNGNGSKKAANGKRIKQGA